MSKEIMDILTPVLGEELAAAIIEHRKSTIKKPLTAYAAKLQVVEYIKTGDPVAAANMQIMRSWRAIYADWYFKELEKQKREAPISQKQETREEYLRRAIRANDWDSKPSADDRVSNVIRMAVAK